MNRKVSICIPVVRLEQSFKCIEAIHENAGIPKEQYEVLTAIDHERIGCPKMLAKLVGRAKHDLICFLGDDTIPQKNFLKHALEEMKKLPDEWGVVGFNSDGNDHAHWLAHRLILDLIPGGEFFPLEYHHCFGDDELKDIAQECGKWTYAIKAKVEHLHPIFAKAEYDEFYQTAYDEGKFEHDRSVYHRRRIERILANRGGRPSIAMAFPLTNAEVYSHFMFSILRIDKPWVDQLLMPDYAGNHDAVRNNLVIQALNLRCTHILMMDTDQIYCDKDMIERMVNWNQPIVGARVHRRYPPFDPLMLRGKIGSFYTVPNDEIEAARNGSKSLIEVDATGCGCVLYDLRVFAKVNYPWFELTTNPETGKPVGEDIGFCAKLKEHDYKVYVDASIEIQHLTLHATDWGTWKTYSKIHKLEQKPGANN